jgi:enoyl-CoA hydratase
MNFDYENILVQYPFQEAETLALIQLNRPKVFNALSTPMMKEIVDALFKLDDLSKVRVILISGSEKAFSAGADIKQLSQMTPIDQIKDHRMRTWKQMALISKPIVACVSGLALGAGCELAMASDIIIASETAKFGQPEIGIGIMPGAGGTQRLTRSIGKAKAMMKVLTGDPFSAKEAFDMGLISKVVPQQTLMEEASLIAKKIASKSPMAIRLAKESINKSQETGLTEGLEFERRNFYLTFSSKDQKEGMEAFLEKRPPQYQGH